MGAVAPTCRSEAPNVEAVQPRFIEIPIVALALVVAAARFAQRAAPPPRIGPQRALARRGVAGPSPGWRAMWDDIRDGGTPYT